MFAHWGKRGRFYRLVVAWLLGFYRAMTALCMVPQEVYIALDLSALGIFIPCAWFDTLVVQGFYRFSPFVRAVWWLVSVLHGVAPGFYRFMTTFCVVCPFAHRGWSLPWARRFCMLRLVLWVDGCPATGFRVFARCAVPFPSRVPLGLGGGHLGSGLIGPWERSVVTA